MIGSIRKHSQAMWWFIIIAVIISFVWFFSPASRNGSGPQSSGNYGVMNGTVITPGIYEEAKREVKLFYFFSSGNWPGRGRALQGFDVERETFNRLLLIQKAKAMGIHASPDMVAKVASDRMRSLTGGKPISVAQFETEVLSQERLNAADFERYIQNEIGIQQLLATLGLAGDLVTDQEIRALYQRDYQELSAQLAIFSSKDHMKSVTVTPEKVGEFYTNQMARYRVPDRVRVNYVEFSLSNFLAAAKQEVNNITNLNDLLDNAIIQMGTNYPPGVKNADEARAKLIENEQRRLAGGNAFKAASEFNKVLTEATPVDPARIAALAKDRGLTAQVTAPFSQNEAPVGLDVGEAFVKQSFALTAQEPFCDPVPGSESIYVISYHSQLPSEIPTLDSIKDRVTQDYQYIESTKLARKAATDFENTVSNTITSGKTFADACDKAGVKLAAIAPFSLSTTNIAELSGRANIDQFKRVAHSTAAGSLTPLMPSADGAFMALVTGKLPLNEGKMALDLPSFSRSVHQVRRSEVFNEWFKREAQKAFSTVPYFQEKQAQMQKAAAPKQ